MTHIEFQPYRKLQGNRITNFTNSITGTKVVYRTCVRTTFLLHRLL